MNKDLILKAIDKLEAIDPASPTAYNEALQAFNGMGGKPFIIGNTVAPITAFRTRTHDDDKLFEHFSDISLTPAYLVKGYGRCNIPYQSIFYCSDFRPTSYLELLQYWVEEKTKNPILHATIGKWTFNSPLRVLIVTSPDHNDRVSDYDKVQGQVLEDFLNHFDDPISAALLTLYKYLFEKFRKPAKHDTKTYIITSAYTNIALMSGQVDAIYYPSVPFDGKGVNLAVSRDYDFDKNVTLEMVARDTFERDDSGEHPSFKQVGFRQVIEINHSQKKVVW